MTRPLPSMASVAKQLAGDKLHAPAAQRNASHICDFLKDKAPQRGTALEIASGTGEHLVTFAKALPDLRWQPTDIETARLRSIDAHLRAAQLDNAAPAMFLDATLPGWAAHHGDQDLILVVNLLHLISKDETITLINEASKALRPSGCLIVYGPFRRDGQLTSQGDAHFDAELRKASPDIGYKDTAEMNEWLAAAGLSPQTPAQLPANNLILLSRRPA